MNIVVRSPASEANADPLDHLADALFHRMGADGVYARTALYEDVVERLARNPELLQLLEHLIVAHLNHPEWGSPRLPLIPEAILLHHVDDLDAKIEMFARCLTQDRDPGPFTARDPILGRQLYKGRSV